MPLLHAVILGIIQGLTEFLPVSSSAHLLWAHELFHIGELDKAQDLAFDVSLHGGTLLAIVAYFWRDILNLVGAGVGSILDRSVANDPNRRLAWFIVIATIPGALFGALLDKFFEETIRAPWIAAIAMICLALVLLLAENVSRRLKDIRHITLGDAIIVGICQAAALIPGVSRSGVTITAGLFRDMERDTAARFSFLLSGPIIAGAVALKTLQMIKAGFPHELKMPFIVGVVTSAVVGFIAISILLNYLRTHSTMVFIVYRILAGLAVIAYVFFLVRH
ncbi:MAG TPA: undecaprenyl-diphosphatase UppP [Blastocatellia bacterium]|nr:undecaprenyl-diphosphatase UppP [Blastocatellia bacterium]